MCFTGVEYNRTLHFDWNDKITIGPLTYSGSNMYEVEIKPSIKLRVTKNEGKIIGEYLGVFFVKSEGLSSDTTGIIGKMLLNLYKQLKNVCWSLAPLKN